MTAVASLRGSGYPVPVVVRAQELRAYGLSLVKIREKLGEETGHRPSDVAILEWTSPKIKARNRLKTNERRSLARGARVREPFPDRSPAFQMARMRALREAGLSFMSIAVVMNVDFGTGISTNQCRYALQHGHLPRTLL